MQTVYLSDMIMTKADLKDPKIDLISDKSLLPLPSCPLCLEKLDSSATGLSQAGVILHEAFIADPNSKRRPKWPHLLEECRVCQI
jgi:hypothetical protein